MGQITVEKIMARIEANLLRAYGGYEIFVNKLTEYHHNNDKIKCHVACKTNGDSCMNPNNTESAEIISDHEFVYHTTRSAVGFTSRRSLDMHRQSTIMLRL